MSRALRTLLVGLPAVLLLAACNGDSPAAEAERGARGTLISVTVAEIQAVEITERTVGRIESRLAPLVMAEVSGRITALHVDAGDRVEVGPVQLEVDAEAYELGVEAAQADMRRLSALLDVQRRELERNADLLARGAINQSAYDLLEAEVAALAAQREAARTQLRMAERDLRNSTLRSPVAGTVDERFVSEGDFVGPNERVFRIVGSHQLRVRLPFPETLADRLEIGQTVRFGRNSPEGVTGRITELRPALSEGAATLEALVTMDNPGGWRPGGSINASVVVAERFSVLVPNPSVVQRPGGEVVYVVENGSVRARPVEVGWRGRAQTEIVAGLDAGERIAVDGAAFLSDGARVRIGGD
jgi:RND family efflux transporter MFP subunit